MANIKNTTITKADGSATLRVPAGTTAQRPSAPSVTWSTGSSLVRPVNGLNLFISGSLNIWSTWQNLPAYLSGTGTLGTTFINESDSISATLSGFTGTIRAYMLRVTSWNTVDLTGWTLFESNKTYLTAADTIGTLNVYYKDFAPGTYTFDNNSAMYIFDFNQDLTVYKGLFRYNTTLGSLEVYTGSAWIAVG